MRVIISMAICLACFCSILPAQTFSEVQKVVGNDREFNLQFGISVAISGDIAVVGAHKENTDATGQNQITEAGAAYIFRKDSVGAWSLAQKIVQGDRFQGDRFGNAVAVWGEQVFVGAEKQDYDENGNNIALSAGAVYLFEPDGNGNWIQVRKFTEPSRLMGNNYGHGIAVDRDHLIISAFGNDYDVNESNQIVGAGAAYIYERSSLGNWALVQKIISSDRQMDDAFGLAVDIEGGRAIVGTRVHSFDLNGGNYLPSAGAAYVFERASSGSWVEVQKLVTQERDSLDQFGTTVAISGNTIAVGAPRETLNASGMDSMYLAGATYIFEREGNGNWIQTQKLVASGRLPNRAFGNDLDLSGDYLMVSGLLDADGLPAQPSLVDAGAVYFFQRGTGGAWSEAHKLVASDRDAEDYFGQTVAVSGNQAIFGAPSEDHDVTGGAFISGAGSAYLFAAPSLMTAEPEPVDLAGIKVFPNPTQGELHFDLGDLRKAGSWRVWNLKSEMVNAGEFGSGISSGFTGAASSSAGSGSGGAAFGPERNININGAPGMYILELRLENGQVFHQKILKR